MIYLAKVAAEILNRPQLCDPKYLDTMIHYLNDRIGVDNSGMVAGQYKAREDHTQASSGVAVVPVIGSLTHRGGHLEAESGMRSYQAISADLDQATADSNIHTILMEFDSPGGSVSGAFELADKINAIADDPEQPRVVAFVNGVAASAAYLLASQANVVLSTRNSLIGSIGVVTAHTDVSGAMEKAGIVKTYMFAGDYKVDGNPTEPLSDETKARVQASIDEAYDLFLDAIDRSGRISAEEARATKADTFTAPKAEDLGLVDEIISEDQLMATVNTMAGISRNQGVNMSKETMFTQAQLDAAVSESLASVKAETSSAVEAAVAAERGRVSGIMGLENYKGREAAAQKLIDKGMSVEDADDFLSAVPVSNATAEVETPQANGDAQKKVLEQLAAEEPKVQSGAAVVVESEMTDQEKFEQEAIASAKSFGAAKGRKKFN